MGVKGVTLTPSIIKNNMDNTLSTMTTLTQFIQNMFGAIFDTFELLASNLMQRPVVFGLGMGYWVLLFMSMGIILGDFIH